MNNLYKILVVDDEIEYRSTLKILLEDAGYECEIIESAAKALKLLERTYFPIIITDIMMEDMNGIEFLKAIKSKYHDEVEIIMVTGYGSVETAVETMKLGAYGYFIKSHDPAELLLELEKLIKTMDLSKLKHFIDENNEEFLRCSNSPKMEKIWDLVDTVANTNANVLILGESGTGKEIIANEIHKKSDRREKPFVAINCQNYPNNLIESELFGHEKGAFTGAMEKRIGKLEQSNGGSVFLDEIGDMSVDIQVKLLRILENKKIERIGSNTLIDVDFRLISATNKDIHKMVDSREFREDFLYRINTIEIVLPPLRERREDLNSLIDFFVKKYSRETGKKINGISPETMDYLMNYNYPGNIRELKNIIERLVIMTDREGLLKMQDMGDIGKIVKQAPDSNDISELSYKDAKRRFDRDYIINAMEKCDNNITKTAEMIGLSRRQLFNKLKEYEITSCSQTEEL